MILFEIVRPSACLLSNEIGLWLDKLGTHSSAAAMHSFVQRHCNVLVSVDSINPRCPSRVFERASWLVDLCEAVITSEERVPFCGLRIWSLCPFLRSLGPMESVSFVKNEIEISSHDSVTLDIHVSVHSSHAHL